MINSSAAGQYYMNNNATVTTISMMGTYVKAAGTTTVGTSISQFTHTDNRLTYTGAFSGVYSILSTCTVTGTNNDNLAIRVAVN